MRPKLDDLDLEFALLLSGVAAHSPPPPISGRGRLRVLRVTALAVTLAWLPLMIRVVHAAGAVGGACAGMLGLAVITVAVFGLDYLLDRRVTLR